MRVFPVQKKKRGQKHGKQWKVRKQKQISRMEELNDLEENQQVVDGEIATSLRRDF